MILDRQGSVRVTLVALFVKKDIELAELVGASARRADSVLFSLYSLSNTSHPGEMRLYTYSLPSAMGQISDPDYGPFPVPSG